MAAAAGMQALARVSAWEVTVALMTFSRLKGEIPVDSKPDTRSAISLPAPEGPILPWILSHTPLAAPAMLSLEMVMPSYACSEISFRSFALYDLKKHSSRGCVMCVVCVCGVMMDGDAGLLRTRGGPSCRNHVRVFKYLHV